jgi:hypothetical protein
MMSVAALDQTILTDQDLYLFNEGTHHRIFESLAPIHGSSMAARARRSLCGLPTPITCR